MVLYARVEMVFHNIVDALDWPKRMAADINNYVNEIINCMLEN
jgi:hypothetical protein